MRRERVARPLLILHRLTTATTTIFVMVCRRETLRLP
jgi:hypothetical protein